MKKYICLVFAKHPGQEKPFLFCVEPLTDIPSGTELMVDTIRGKELAVSVGKSFIVDERAMESIVTAVGAYLPLKQVIGTVNYEIVKKRTVTPIGGVDPLPF